MTDDRLEELLDDAARTYRVPPEPDLAAIWADVEREAFADKQRWRRHWPGSPSWRVFAMAIAASLLVGVSLGRIAPRAQIATVASGDSALGALPSEYDRTATDLLGRTAVLLTSLPIEGRSGGSDRFTSQASELLTTTRLLLDSPAAASDHRFKELLNDLELILAQVARLRAGHGQEEMELITDALEERDLMPRIRSAVAMLSMGDD